MSLDFIEIPSLLSTVVIKHLREINLGEGKDLFGLQLPSYC